MVRIIVQVTDAGMAANVGGPVHMSFKFIDIENAELEAVLAEKLTYSVSRVIGAEVITSPSAPSGEARG